MTIKILAAHTLTIFRAEDAGSEALAVPFLASSFLAVASLVVFSNQ